MISLAKKTFILFTLFTTALVSASTRNDPEIVQIMKQYDATGTVIIASENQIKYIYNTDRARTPLSPASTFKIANTIIALELDAIKDENEVVKWDKTKYDIETWNQDQTLKTAFKYSCVPTYQYLAKKIGSKNYTIFLNKLHYGQYKINKDNLITFWLKDGGLYISPIDQINFLQKIYTQQLPISERTYKILKNIMLTEDNANYQIYAKTGAATENWKGHGWYVGYVISQNKPWFFVLNIDIHNYNDLSKRTDIVKAILQKKNII